MIVRELVPAFLRWCAQHRSATTAKQYGYRLKTFLERFGDRDFSDVTPLELDDWLHGVSHWPDGRKKAPDTIRVHAVVFETMQSWAMTKRVIASKIVDKLEKPMGRKRERVPSDAEIAKLLSLAAPDFALIYRAMLQCGARPGELCRATVEDISPDGGVIELAEHKTAHSTGETRRIQVGKKLRALIDAAIGERTDGPIFVRSNSKPWTSQALSAKFRQLRDQAGFDRDLVLYCARHRHGTDVCRFKDIRAAQRALGHKDIKTTQRYVHESEEELRGTQDLFDVDAA